MSRDYNFSISLIEKISKNTDHWGGKASILSEIIKSGIPVPSGIVIGTKWYQKYLSVCSKVKSSESFEIFFENLLNLIKENPGWKYISTFPIIARSSSTSESNTNISFSGIFESKIIKSENEIIKGIKWVCYNAAIDHAGVF